MPGGLTGVDTTQRKYTIHKASLDVSGHGDNDGAEARGDWIHGPKIQEEDGNANPE